MPRKYAGPLLPGQRSAKTTKTTKQASQINKLQRQVKTLVEVNPREEKN